MDAVTAVSGSGPAYFYLLMEHMERAAVELGLSPELAAALTRETALGAARVVIETRAEPARLRAAVTSPGGTTAAALRVFAGRESGRHRPPGTRRRQGPVSRARPVNACEGSNTMQNALVFILRTLFDLYVLTFALRLLLQWAAVDKRNPLVQFILRVTGPLVIPLRRFAAADWPRRYRHARRTSGPQARWARPFWSG